MSAIGFTNEQWHGNVTVLLLVHVLAVCRRVGTKNMTYARGAGKL